MESLCGIDARPDLRRPDANLGSAANEDGKIPGLPLLLQPRASWNGALRRFSCLRNCLCFWHRPQLAGRGSAVERDYVFVLGQLCYQREPKWQESSRLARI